ncbi:MAG TPA: L-histidine N(alpha)-methyltransferase [Thermoanaerobaculia bacterium]
MSEPTAQAGGRRARFTLRRVASGDRTFPEDIRAGLTAVPKSIPPRYFYDDLGSALFEAICNLPEYYPTRTESELLRRSSREIITSAGDVRRIVELGSGAAHKTRFLLDELSRAERELEYVPVDIDPHILEKSGRELLTDYPRLRVNAVFADFTRPAQALADSLGEGRTLVIFLGSTVGNFHPPEAAVMMRGLRGLLRPGDGFLLGVDLKKSKEILDAAYNDALGVTAAFNLNLLQRINRELGANFDLSAFAHRAHYDVARGRIEMHLASLREQSVLIGALELDIAFGEGEMIHTENSYKYDESDLLRLASDSGFEIVGQWIDSRRWFADVLMRVR